ncbi:GNAT family N-acetyltransferase [Tuberibacillus sp. Marseille-P3662]|uniref:GNAT family N-acetyltransferase n=1 Tax=Tuberibacillus sp. Marseille-P3662 TaxID=1965358 RepID=UPI000A1CD48A|nr:N-acetyltransferase [Tuberibacillus sp. Marseille-P3662]
MTIAIRPFKQQDIEQLIVIENSIWNHRNTPIPIHFNNKEEFLSSRTGRILIAEEQPEANICGYVEMQYGDIASRAHIAELAIGIHSDFRGSGLGASLLSYAEKRLTADHIKKISLRVMASNPRALRFYEKYGYQQEGCLKNEFYINDQYIDDVLLYKWLS